MCLGRISARAIYLDMSPSLLDLPNELLLRIAAFSHGESDLNALVQTNRRLYALLNSYLYRRNAEEGGGLALRWAAAQNRERTALLALSEGKANIDAAGTTFILSCSESDYALAQRAFRDLFVEAKRDIRFFSPLQIAIIYRFEAMARLLIEHGADVRKTFLELSRIEPIHAASSMGLVGTMQVLPDRGVSSPS